MWPMSRAQPTCNGHVVTFVHTIPNSSHLVYKIYVLIWMPSHSNGPIFPNEAYSVLLVYYSCDPCLGKSLGVLALLNHHVMPTLSVECPKTFCFLPWGCCGIPNFHLIMEMITLIKMTTLHPLPLKAISIPENPTSKIKPPSPPTKISSS